MTDIPGADARHREQERIRKEYPDLYYYAVGVALVVALMIAGYALFPDRDGYLTNLFTEAASVAVTLLVLNRMAEARERRRYKQDLIYRMGSQVNAEAIRAVEELRQHGWLTDGSLRAANLRGANLEGARLGYADLEGTNLNIANLKGAFLGAANLKSAEVIGVDLSGSNLVQAKLGGALMMAAILEDANLWDACLEGANLEDAILNGAVLALATLPNGDTWHPGYDMSIFTDPSDGSEKEQPITDHQTEDASRPPTSPLPPGTPGEVLLQRIHKFDFTPEDLEEMSRAIEEDCERIDPQSFSDSAT